VSYPQPSSNGAVNAAQDFFRLNTPLVSPGDIYESEVGALAFAIGPESDLANIAIDYYDTTQAPTFMNSVAISVSRTMVGQISPDLTQTYQPSNVPGRTLIRPTDLYNPSIDLATIVGFPIDDSYFVAPQLDVIQYFNQQPGLVPSRNDKTFEFQRIGNAAATWAIVIPYYGRKSGSYRFVNNAAVNQGFGLWSINYTIGDANNGYAIENIVAFTSEAAGAIVKGSIEQSTNGTFDALVAVVQTAGTRKFALRVDVSDTD